MVALLELLKSCQIQSLTNSEGIDEVLISCNPSDFSLLVRLRKYIPQALNLSQAKVTLSAQDRVTSFEVLKSSALR